MNLSPDVFLTKSLEQSSWGMKAARIMAASLAAVDPGKILIENLIVLDNKLQVKEEIFNLDEFQRIFILAVGKAGLPMGLAAAKILGSSLEQAFILTKPAELNEIGDLPGNFQVYYGGHPIPDQTSISSTTKILDHLSNLTPQDLVLVLISGGGSALLTYPAQGISLDQLQRTNQALLESGAAIQQINIIRKHLSRVKGGQLSKILSPATIISLVLSDVMGDQLDMISSGPTAPDNSTFQDALSIIHQYDLSERLDQPVLDYLEAGCRQDKSETPKSGDPIFDQTWNFIIASNQNAVDGGLQQAILEGFNAIVLPEAMIGEAKLLGRTLVHELLLRSRTDTRPACYLAGGETTVTLPESPAPGKGGRNLELALSTVKELANVQDACIVTLATDGEDGVTDAAGAVVTGETYLRGMKLGNDPDDFLSRHDSYSYFQALDDLVMSGQTQTNVNDLFFLFLM